VAEDLDLAILGAVPMALLLLDGRDRVAAANDAAQALFGQSPAGRMITDLIRHPDFHETLARSRATGRRSVARIALSTRSGGAQFDIHITPRPGGDGAIVAFEDQTALERATEIRRDFIANVSHELRTPLTALVGFIETLRGAARDDPAARDRFLTIMEREAGRMIRLVNDLLSLNRVEADEHRRPSETVEMNALVRSVITTQRDRAAAAGVAIDLVSDAPEMNARGDPDQLLQVFHNLAENAIKYGASGGRLTFALRRLAQEPKLRGPAIEVEVADEGEGIDPIHLPRLTERFYRVDSHRSREKGGTGLGLAIVKHIVNRHRGRLRIESEPGKGSRFIVILPAAGTAPGTTPPGGGSGRPAPVIKPLP
jgi:two-component system, OmpR family, phosphate regulon sensor histidine kinase PhoR